MVSPWQENGNILDCIKRDPTVNRLRFICDAANGLAYLHSEKVKVVHGNLRATNVLVSDDFKACICDFGMAKAVEDVTDQSASQTLTKQGSARWLAPELIDGDVTSPTMACDTYSFAMMIFESFADRNPYHRLKRDAQVIHSILERRMPDRPVEGMAQRWVTDDIWAVMTSCWAFEPERRPTMADVAQRLTQLESSFVVDSDYPMSS